MTDVTADESFEYEVSPRGSTDENTEGSENELFDIDPQDEIVSTTYEITSYGADYDVEGLIRRMNKGDIVVPSFEPSQPGLEVSAFQRGFVWRKTQMSRFIESLLLGLPVPGIFLVKDNENRLLVLDGQQRLRSLQKFYDGRIDDRVFRLSGVQAPFEGQTYDELRAEDRRRLDDSIIHATVLRDDSSSGSHDAVYSIYERLNTGGTPLQPQEIRIALYEGQFLRGIAKLNDDEDWRNLYGPRSTRFRDHELILRTIALYDWQDRYRKPLKTFLNAYLDDHRDRALSGESGLGKLFLDAVHQVNQDIGKPAFRPERALNIAFADSILVGIMRRINSGVPFREGELKNSYNGLAEDGEFTAATTLRTSDEDYVNLRLDKATAAFAA